MTPADTNKLAPAAVVTVSDGELTALLALAQGGAAGEHDLPAATAAGWIVDGRPAGILADGLTALVAPVCQIELERGDRRGRGAADGRCATLVVPAAQAGSLRLMVVTTQFLPDVLCRLNDVSPRARARPDMRLRYAVGDLARIIATRDATLAADLVGPDEAATAARLATVLREHWRVEARWSPADGSPGRRAVEVIDTDDGVWLVVPDGASVELWPTTPTQVFRQLSRLLPDGGELAPESS